MIVAGVPGSRILPDAQADGQERRVQHGGCVLGAADWYARHIPWQKHCARGEDGGHDGVADRQENGGMVDGNRGKVFLIGTEV